MISVRIRAWALEVEITSTDSFPDHLDDLVNRALVAFRNSTTILQETKIPMFDPELPDEDELEFSSQFEPELENIEDIEDYISIDDNTK